jgi:hypothetical protein
MLLPAAPSTRSCSAAPRPPCSVDQANTSGRPLRRVVRSGWDALRQTLEAADRRLPAYVTREVERTLACGDPADGFAWLACPVGHHHRLVPFSCQTRGFCPSCGGRRMAERAWRWTEALIPRVAVRQLVLTVPWPRRWLLARRPELARGVLRCALAEVTRWLRREAVHRGALGEPGTVTVVQRFGAALNLNLHFHILLLDGLFVAQPDGAPRFRRTRRWRQGDVDGLVVRIAERCEAWLARQGFGADAEGDDDSDSDPDDALPLLQSASVAGRSAVRGQRKARRVQKLGGRAFVLPPLCASCDGYSLHAGVVIGARDRAGLRQLVGYIARPPLAQGRVEVLPGDRVRLQLKRPWSDGTTALELSAEELAERLVALVPPPRANQVLYGGVLAARHRWNHAVRPRPPKRRAAPPGVGLRLTRSGAGRSRWTPWSVLLWRVFGVNGVACPTCGRVMTLRALVRPPATLTVLASLARSARGPPPGDGGAAEA